MSGNSFTHHHITWKKLKNIYENSNFYKEARIISFIDRLVQTIITKIKIRVSIPISIKKGIKNYQEYSSIELAQAKIIITKF